MSDIEKKVNDAELNEVAGGAVNTNYFVYTIVYGDTLSAIASTLRSLSSYSSTTSRIPI
jgi:hypothetical protein